jgi:4-diphosphocytidyl-2-C-methyl-D-erythritol kinase
MANSVDMMAAAKDAQFEAASFMGQGTIKLIAPAKVNLFLGIGERRADGYHDVYNIMHTLLLHDIVYMNATPLPKRPKVGEGDIAATYAICGSAQNIAMRIEISDKTCTLGEGALQVDTTDNLAFKAVDALAQTIGVTDPYKVDIRIEKHIPAQAGLGGGSADCAAALVGAAHFWGVPTEDEVLAQTAAALGADVAFFLEGGAAAYRSAGEIFDHSLTPAKDALVLVKPASGVSTAAAYGAFDKAPVAIPADLLACAKEATAAADVPLFNNLEGAARTLNSEVADAIEFLKAQPELDPTRVLMSGSGSAVFAIAPSFAAASAVSARAQKSGLWSRATTFANLRACH